MPKYVIERDLPGAGKLSPQELQAVSQKSCAVLKNLGPQIQWVHSYVTQDKILLHLYCAEREAYPRTREPRWLPRQSRLGSKDDDRSDDFRVGGPSSQTASHEIHDRLSHVRRRLDCEYGALGYRFE
jgi:hypothetical protein